MKSKRNLGDSESTITTGTFEMILEEYAGPAKAGYGRNPYNAVPNVREPGATTRPTDLRKLSEWIRAKKSAEQLKESDKDPEKDPKK